MCIGRSLGAELLSRVDARQSEIARRVGVTQGIVSQWLSGKKRPRDSSREVLFRVYRIPLDAWHRPAGDAAGVEVEARAC